MSAFAIIIMFLIALIIISLIMIFYDELKNGLQKTFKTGDYAKNKKVDGAASRLSNSPSNFVDPSYKGKMKASKGGKNTFFSSKVA